MAKNRPKTMDSLLQQPEGDVKALMDRLARIQTVNRDLKSYFNPTIAPHCRAVNIRKSTLVVAVDSPAWANKVRFQLSELLSHLRKNGFVSLANIELIVQPK